MTLEERLEALALHHEDIARSVRTTLALLMNGARATAAKSLPQKLAAAAALRNGSNGAAPETPPRLIRLRRDSATAQLLAWLARDDSPRTVAEMNAHFDRKFTLDFLVKNGALQIVQGTHRPYTYTISALGRATLARAAKDAPPRQGTRAHPLTHPLPPQKKGAAIEQLRGLMQGLPKPIGWEELQQLAHAKGITTLTAQAIGSAKKHKRIKVTGAEHHRRYRWIGA